MRSPRLAARALLSSYVPGDPLTVDQAHLLYMAEKGNSRTDQDRHGIRILQQYIHDYEHARGTFRKGVVALHLLHFLLQHPLLLAHCPTICTPFREYLRDVDTDGIPDAALQEEYRQGLSDLLRILGSV
jgi:hypothetical protein